MPDYLDAAEVRQILGISSATFYRWLRDGTLNGGAKVGGRWRFPREAVEALLAASDAQQQDDLEDLDRARQVCRERLVRTGIPEKEIEAMLESSKSDGEAIAHLVVSHGVNRNATDIHLAPVADGMGIRERVDGVLVGVDPPLPQGASKELVQALKGMAGMNPAVTDRAQGGHFFASVSGRKIDVRASTFPTWSGESMTLRLLDPASVRLQLREVGFSNPIYLEILKAIKRPHGVFLVNGPTGSGKTTTLYCALTAVYRPGLKVMTIEDPIEIHLDGVLQANVTPGMDFKDGMIAMLRNDLDIGMVGELRDTKSIELLFQMGTTGHMVMSALHAPDAVSALQRVLSIGEVEPRILIDVLRGILDQRLVRRSCRYCRSMGRLRDEDRDLLLLPAADRRGSFAYNEGCEKCNETGVLGRVPVGEFLTITPRLAELIEGGNFGADLIRAALPDDHRTLRDDIISKLQAGEVSPPEMIPLLE